MKVGILVGCLFLASCGWLPSRFDSAEFDHIVKLKYMVANANRLCGAPEVKTQVKGLVEQSSYINIYLSHKQTDTEVLTSMATIDTLIAELNTAYSRSEPPSVVYCEVKTDSIGRGISYVLSTLGSK